MTIQLPRLDDRTYDQLADVLRRHVPTSEWTDHNASDPGIMLLELLAWLGEMVLYRMDQVPRAHRDKFLDFLIDPPEPVTVLVELQATFQASPATASLTIPAGTLVATDFSAGRRFVFETYQPLVLNRPAAPPLTDSGVLAARAILEVTNEPLGVSDGTAQQIFELRPPRLALGIAAGVPAPILVDFAHRAGGYEPNPVVSVGGVAWRPVPSLLTADSNVSAPDAGRRYLVDARNSRIQFGDGTFGAIPGSGAVITCTRYAVLDGPPALGVRRGDVAHLLNVVVPGDVALAITDNTDAEGGDAFFSPDRRAELGLRAFRAPYRLVTERDFERALLGDFNDFQARAGRPERIVRASITIDRRPAEPSAISELIDAPSHVSLVLLATPVFDGDQFRNELVGVSAKQGMLDLGNDLWSRVHRFLEPRRLITTRLDRHTPRLVPFTIATTVFVGADQSVADLDTALRQRIYDFMSPVSGDESGRGWRLGRNVYRSQLFRLLEDTPGVDHVASLAFSPANADGNVEVAPHELPLLQTLTLTVVRS